MFGIHNPSGLFHFGQELLGPCRFRCIVAGSAFAFESEEPAAGNKLPAIGAPDPAE
jgi:hypothetical protein